MTGRITRVSERGRDWLAVLEGGYRLDAYLDHGGVPTISAGLTYYPASKRRVRLRETIGAKQARLFFAMVLEEFEVLVDSVTRDDLEQREFDALVALAYNIGPSGFRGSTAVRRVNAGLHFAEIAEAWKRWHFDDGQSVEGLIHRRQCELDVYARGEYHDQGGTIVPEVSA